MIFLFLIILVTAVIVSALAAVYAVGAVLAEIWPIGKWAVRTAKEERAKIKARGRR